MAAEDLLASGGMAAASAVNPAFAALGGVAELGKLGLGISQAVRARNIAKRYRRPMYQIPGGATEALANQRNMAMGEAPGLSQARQIQAQNQAASTAAILNSGGGGAERLAALTQMNGANNQNALQMGATQQQWAAQQKGNLNSELNNFANWQEKKQDFDTIQPYQQAMQKSADMRDAANKNIYGAAKSIGGLVGSFIQKPGEATQEAKTAEAGAGGLLGGALSRMGIIPNTAAETPVAPVADAIAPNALASVDPNSLKFDPNAVPPASEPDYQALDAAKQQGVTDLRAGMNQRNNEVNPTEEYNPELQPVAPATNGSPDMATEVVPPGMDKPVAPAVADQSIPVRQGGVGGAGKLGGDQIKPMSPQVMADLTSGPNTPIAPNPPKLMVGGKETTVSPSSSAAILQGTPMEKMAKTEEYLSEREKAANPAPNPDLKPVAGKEPVANKEVAADVAKDIANTGTPEKIVETLKDIALSAPIPLKDEIMEAIGDQPEDGIKLPKVKSLEAAKKLLKKYSYLSK